MSAAAGLLTARGGRTSHAAVVGRQMGKVCVVGAEEIKVVEPTEVKRARNTDGTLRADDKKTPDYNEAWEGGKAPEKKGSTKKK